MLKRYLLGTKSEKHLRATEDEHGEPVKDPQLLLAFEVDNLNTLFPNSIFRMDNKVIIATRRFRYNAVCKRVAPYY
jgi:hypothetical protein